MQITFSQPRSETQIQQIVEALETLPSVKVTEVHDFVRFLQGSYAVSETAGAGYNRNEQDTQDPLAAIFMEERPAPPLAPAEFEREMVAFQRLESALEAQYGGRVVAIHGGEVVAVGDDKMAVLDTVLASLGPVPWYIDRVAPGVPRRVRVPSAWIAR